MCRAGLAELNNLQDPCLSQDSRNSAPICKSKREWESGRKPDLISKLGWKFVLLCKLSYSEMLDTSSKF